MRATRPPRPYRATYDAVGGSHLTLDFMAENGYYAIAHAFHVLNADAHVNGLRAVLKVKAIKLEEAKELGAFVTA